MRITTRAVWQMTADGGFELLERDSYEYSGPVAAAKGGSSSSSSSSSAVNTQNLNLQEIDGVAVAGVDGNVSIETTDQGTVDAARDIALRGLDTGLTGFQEAVDLGRDVVASGERGAQAVVDAGVTLGQESADLARDAISFTESQTRNVLDFASGAQREAVDLVADSQDRSFDFAGDVNRGFQESVTGLTEDFLQAGERLVGDVIEFAGGTGNQIIAATERIQARESGNTDARLEQITRVALIGAAVIGVGALYVASRK